MIVIPGVEHRYRKRPDGSIERTADILANKTDYTYTIPLAGVDLSIFISCGQHFVEEAKFIRRGEITVLMVLTGYAAHSKCKTLKYFRYNDILVVGLPARTSHTLNPLHFGVLGRLNDEFKSFCHVGRYTHLGRQGIISHCF